MTKQEKQLMIDYERELWKELMEAEKIYKNTISVKALKQSAKNNARWILDNKTSKWVSVNELLLQLGLK